MRCRFCSAPAAATYALDAGCLCYPEDREQALCVQHIIRATPLGAMRLLAVVNAAEYAVLPARFK